MTGGAWRRVLGLGFAAIAVGCAHASTGAAIGAPRDHGWVVVPHLTMVAQLGDADCGPAALATALTRWDSAPSPNAWQPRAGENREHEGFSAGSLRDEARRVGFQSYVLEGTFADLTTEIAAGHPVVIGLVLVEHGQRLAHFAVVVGHDVGAQHWLLADPALGVHSVARDELRTDWGHAGWVTVVVFPETDARASSRGARLLPARGGSPWEPAVFRAAPLAR